MRIAEEVLPYYLFGIYVTEIAKFFDDRFRNKILINDNATIPKSLQVVYGTPRAAFRYILEQVNGKINLPMMNFFSATVNRVLLRERPGVQIWSSDSYDPETNTLAVMRSPMHFDVNFSFNLWTNNYRERDFIMHEIFQSFPMGEVSLVFFPDTSVVNGRTVINDRTSYLLMPLKLDMSFNDETQIEGLDQKEVRDAIKTTFTIMSDTIVPYNCYRIPVAMGVGIISSMRDDVDDPIRAINDTFIFNQP